MCDRTGRVRSVSYALVAWAVVLILLGGCVPLPAVIEPPRVPGGITDVVLNASPRDIALTRSDLPAGFQLATEKSSGHEYVALYLRPSALETEASGGNTLLSVITSLGVYTTTAQAEQVYLGVSADPKERAVEDIALVSKGATDVVTASFPLAAQGANASEAFRVSYRLMETPVFEYGHRFRIGNVLAYVVVAAIGNPNEPEDLVKAARDIVQRQIDHIAEAAAQGAPK